jgi:hypothetical protein
MNTDWLTAKSSENTRQENAHDQSLRTETANLPPANQDTPRQWVGLVGRDC